MAKENPGWFSGSAEPIKVTIDIAIGETSKIESEDKGKMDDIAQRVKGLNAKLEDIRREQVFQRVRTLLYSSILAESYAVPCLDLHENFFGLTFCL